MAFLLGGICFGAPTAAHACCPEPTTWQHPTEKPEQVAPCCIQQPVNILGIDKQGLPLLDNDASVVVGTPAFWDWDGVLAPQHLALLRKAFLKDQSQRHLELSVLLN